MLVKILHQRSGSGDLRRKVLLLWEEAVRRWMRKVRLLPEKPNDEIL